MNFLWTEMFIDLFKAMIWPLFIVLLICLFKKTINKLIRIFVKRFARDSVKIGHGQTYVSLEQHDDPPSTKEKDRLRAELLPPEDNIDKRLKRRPPGYLSLAIGGFFKYFNGSSMISQEMEIPYAPWIKEAEGKSYEIGQKVEFSIFNISKEDLEFPLCAVEFPRSFMHLDTEHPESGRLTINSDLWGMGRRSTQLREISDETMEISSVPTRVLKPNEGLRFFVRFNLPNITKEYTLRIKFGRMGKEEESSYLLLKVKKSKKILKTKIKTKIKKK